MYVKGQVIAGEVVSILKSHKLVLTGKFIHQTLSSSSSFSLKEEFKIQFEATLVRLLTPDIIIIIIVVTVIIINIVDILPFNIAAVGMVVEEMAELRIVSVHIRVDIDLPVVEGSWISDGRKFP